MSTLILGGSPATGTSASPARRLAQAAASASDLLVLWRHRAATRRHLAGLDRRMLADVGLDRATAAQEAGKPFWR